MEIRGEQVLQDCLVSTKLLESVEAQTKNSGLQNLTLSAPA